MKKTFAVLLSIFLLLGTCPFTTFAFAYDRDFGERAGSLADRPVAEERTAEDAIAGAEDRRDADTGEVAEVDNDADSAGDTDY